MYGVAFRWDKAAGSWSSPLTSISCLHSPNMSSWRGTYLSAGITLLYFNFQLSVSLIWCLWNTSGVVPRNWWSWYGMRYASRQLDQARNSKGVLWECFGWEKCGRQKKLLYTHNTTAKLDRSGAVVMLHTVSFHSPVNSPLVFFLHIITSSYSAFWKKSVFYMALLFPVLRGP
jgi:hypothetical protein